MKRLLVPLVLLWLAIGLYTDIQVERRAFPHKPGGWSWTDRVWVVAHGPLALYEMLES